MKIEHVLPEEIEKRSFEIITEELGERRFPPEEELIVKRVIHTTADFDYLLMHHPDYIKGKADVSFIEERMQEILEWDQESYE